MGIVRRVVRESGLALVVAGLIVLLFVGYQLLGTNLTEQHNQSRLRQEFNQDVAAHAATVPSTTTAPATTVPGSPTPTTAPSTTTAKQTAVSGTDNPTVGGEPPGAAVPLGGAIDHLVIPAIGVDKYVVQGVSQSDLTEGPGHYPQTVLPGQVGNAAIAGHRTTYGAPFFRLNGLKAGDNIFVTDTADHRFTYQVKTIEVVAPDDVSVLDPTKTAQLTLTTCNPRFAESSRLVVVAALYVPKSHTPAKSSTTHAPTTVPATTTTTTPPPAPTGHLAALNLGQGDTAARTPALAYGALVVFLWVLTRIAIHRTRRWKRSLAYVIGIVACLVVLWFCFENVVRLLPPNI